MQNTCSCQDWGTLKGKNDILDKSGKLEVWLHKNGLDTSISYSERNPDDIMLVYVDVNTAAVKAIIPADEFSVHNPANSDNRIIE